MPSGEGVKTDVKLRARPLRGQQRRDGRGVYRPRNIRCRTDSQEAATRRCVLKGST
jgi:hypothetical protein